MTVLLVTLFVVAAAVLLGTGQGRKLWRTIRPDWPRRVVRKVRQRLRPGRHRDLAELPGHPERIPPPPGFVDDPFCAITEQLLDDEREPRLADVAERIGWLR